MGVVSVGLCSRCWIFRCGGKVCGLFFLVIVRYILVVFLIRCCCVGGWLMFSGM